MNRYRKISDYELLLKRAEEMLLNPTHAEKKLRIELLKNFEDAEFRFQVVMVPFIVDNVSIKHRLIIEIDGSSHDLTVDSDEIRQRNLESDGYRFLRFTNNEILNNLSNVLKLIKFELQKPLPTRKRTPHARTKKSRRFNRPPHPITIGDKSIIDPITDRPYIPNTDEEIEELGEYLTQEVILEKNKNIRQNQDRTKRVEKAKFKEQQVLNFNKSRKFVCQKCNLEIKLGEPRIAHRIRGEVKGWAHRSCQ